MHLWAVKGGGELFLSSEKRQTKVSAGLLRENGSLCWTALLNGSNHRFSGTRSYICNRPPGHPPCKSNHPMGHEEALGKCVDRSALGLAQSVKQRTMRISTRRVHADAQLTGAD